jgi:hypothetical protein
MFDTTDYAIDIETLSTSRWKLPAIVEIGAVAFDRETGAIEREFHERIDLDDALHLGNVDGDALRFWFGQPHAHSVMAKGYRQTIRGALIGLYVFLTKGASTNYWAWGAEFDMRILMGTIEAMSDMDWIDYHEVRDARTYCNELAAQFGIVQPVQDPRTKHNALEDAKHCARLVSGVYQQMMVIKERIG